MKKQMIKRADGSYSQRGLWDNIRANRGSGKKPTAQMLKQEKKIKAKMAEGGISNPGFKALPGYVQAKITSNMQEGGMMPQSSAGQSVLREAMMMSKMQDGGKMPNSIARARFMAAAKGNIAEAKETASKYGYKMQTGGVRFNSVQMDSSKPGFDFAKASAASMAAKPTPAKPKYIPPAVDTRSYGDNARVQSNIVDRGAITKNQAMIAKSKTVAGKAELQATKARVTESMAKQAEAKIEAEKQRQIKSSNADIMGGLGDDAKISDYVGAFNKSDARASELETMYNLDKTQTGSRIRTGYDTDTYDASKLTKEQVDANYANSGNRLGLFSTRSPLVTAGLASPTSKSFVDSYMNPLVYAETMAASGMRGIEESQSTDGNIGDAMKGVGAAGISFALGKGIGSKLHGLEHGLSGAASKAIRNKAMPMLLNAESNAAQQAISGTARGLQASSNQAIKQGIVAGEHAIVHNVSPMYGTPAYTPAPTTFGKGGLKEMYYMKNGGQFPERYKKMGFSGVDKPKRTTSGGKSHAVVTKVDGNYKLIRFGQAGEVGSPDGTARNKAFKARHAKNIAKGKSSAAYWANKVKW